MKLLQQIDIEIRIFGMVELENGDQILGAACDPQREPEFWDISIYAYPEGFDENHYVLLEMENIIHQPELDYWLNKLGEFFPDAEVEFV